MKKYIVSVLVFLLAFVCMGMLVSAYDGETYEDTLAIGDDGEYHCRVPYGYTWEVDYIDGVIVGEDVTICTTVEAYETCNAKWAITNILEKQEDGTYIAVRRAIVGQGLTPKIELGENQVAFVVHSGGSVPQNCLGSYENWVGKVTACAIRTGDVFEVDLESETMTVYANGEHIAPVVESSDAESEEIAVSATPEQASSAETLVSAQASSEQSDAPDMDGIGIWIGGMALLVAVGVVVAVYIVARRKRV